MERLAKCTGGQIVLTMACMDGEEAFDPRFRGAAEQVVDQLVGDNDFTFVKGCAGSKSCTILLRGANEYMLDESERSVHDALSAVSRTLESNFVVPGGGVVETALSLHFGLSRCLVPLALAYAHGRRVVNRNEARKHGSTKFIAGVPVLNYHDAYDGHASLLEDTSNIEENWLLTAKPYTSDEELDNMCRAAANGCLKQGHPSEGGVPYIEIKGHRVVLGGCAACGAWSCKFRRARYYVLPRPRS